MTINLTNPTNMDQFGVLAESIGYKPRHGNSAPMAQLKSKPQTNPISNSANGVHPMTDFVVFESFDLDDIFYTQKKTTGPPGSTHHIPNILDQESLFPFTSYPANEDLFPDFLHPNPTSKPGLNCCNADDLFPGFGFVGISTPTYDTRSGVNVSQPSSSPADDPFSVPEPVSGGSFPGGQKPAPSTSVPEDFISFEDVYTSGAFKNRDGESDEQRRGRLNSHMRIQERMVNALSEKRRRDVQILQDQEERSRLADTLDYKIKRWASGKEGDVRALLLSLQDVLWPQSGWQMASSRELIESKSVKKVYNRAIVYLHPDKAQQKGFSPEEKYIAEKVFYVLMEAYKVFQAQELR